MKNSAICAIKTITSRRKKNIIFGQLPRIHPLDARDRPPARAVLVHPTPEPGNFSRRRSAARREKRRPPLRYTLSVQVLSQLALTESSNSKADSIPPSHVRQRRSLVHGFPPPKRRLCSFHPRPKGRPRCCRSRSLFFLSSLRRLPQACQFRYPPACRG